MAAHTPPAQAPLRPLNPQPGASAAGGAAPGTMRGRAEGQRRAAPAQGGFLLAESPPPRKRARRKVEPDRETPHSRRCGAGPRVVPQHRGARAGHSRGPTTPPRPAPPSRAEPDPSHLPPGRPPRPLAVSIPSPAVAMGPQPPRPAPASPLPLATELGTEARRHWPEAQHAALPLARASLRGEGRVPHMRGRRAACGGREPRPVPLSAHAAGLRRGVGPCCQQHRAAAEGSSLGRPGPGHAMLLPPLHLLRGWGNSPYEAAGRLEISVQSHPLPQESPAQRTPTPKKSCPVPRAFVVFLRRFSQP